MISKVLRTLLCLSIINGKALSIHLSNDRVSEHTISSNAGNPSLTSSSSGTIQHHSSINPYRRIASPTETDRERMMFIGGGRRGRPIVTGRVHMTTGDIDGSTNFPSSSLTMLQDNEFPIRREPFFFVDSEGDADEGGDGGGGVFEELPKPQIDHYNRFDDGSYEIMEDIFNRGDGMYRKLLPIHHQGLSYPYYGQSQKGLQELFDRHEMVGGIAHEDITPRHHIPGSLDTKIKQKMERKRTQAKKSMEKAKLPGSIPLSSSTTGVEGVAVAAAVPSPTNLNEQQKNTNQQQLLHPNSNNKRSGINNGIGAPPPVTHSIASQLMLRTARGQRQYDVPQIECPSAIDGMERFACPTPDLQGRYRCIDDHVLCDGFIDCPEGEDEDRRSCMFYKTTKAHLDVLADALLRWARGR